MCLDRTLNELLQEGNKYLYLPLFTGEVNNSVVSVHRWLKGWTLDEQLKHGLTSISRKRIARALADAVRMINKEGVAHLDLKPTNAIVHNPDGRPFIHLIDLDSAKINGVGVRDQPRCTSGYFAPEHVDTRYGELTTKSDSFSLGIMLYLLLFLRHPFDGQNYADAILNGPLVIPASRYHRDVVQQVLNCLEPEQHRRPGAGWIHRAFHEAYRDGNEDLEAVSESDFWHPMKLTAYHEPANKTYIEVLPLDLAGTTEYSYFESAELDWQQFRAAKLDRFACFS